MQGKIAKLKFYLFVSEKSQDNKEEQKREKVPGTMKERQEKCGNSNVTKKVETKCRYRLRSPNIERKETMPLSQEV
jgi:hypothetical protein